MSKRIKTLLLLTAVCFLLSVNLFPQEVVNVSIETAFGPNPAPQRPIADLWVREIDAAQSSVVATFYNFTLFDVRDALIRAKRRGVDVRIVVDRLSLTTSSGGPNCPLYALAFNDIPVKLYVPDDTRNLMHHKFMVIDENTLATGSANFTLSAAQFNHENVILIKRLEKTQFIQSYLNSFSAMWNDQFPFIGRFVDWQPNPDLCR